MEFWSDMNILSDCCIRTSMDVFVDCKIFFLVMKKTSLYCAFTHLPAVARRLVVGKVVRDPLVDSGERRHLVRGVDDGQADEGGVTDGGKDRLFSIVSFCMTLALVQSFSNSATTIAKVCNITQPRPHLLAE